MSSTIPAGIISATVSAVKWLASPVLRLLLGPRQERAVKAAYKRAVNASFQNLPPSLSAQLRSGMKAGPARAEMVKILGGPPRDVEHHIIERELRRTGLDVEKLQIPVAVLIDEVNDRFVQELKGEPETQSALTGSYAEEMLGILADARSRPLPAKKLASAAERLRCTAGERRVWYQAEHRLPETGVQLRLRLSTGAQGGEPGSGDHQHNGDRIVGVPSLISESLGGASWVIKAPAGAGKSTVLLQLVEMLLESDDQPIPVLLNLADWLPGDQDLLAYACDEFKASRPEMESLASSDRLFWLLDGWNEIAIDHQSKAARDLRSFLRRHRSAGVVISTRLHDGVPLIGPVKRVTPLPLTREQRRQILEMYDLPDSRAFLETVEQSPELDELTRTPLFLAAAIEIGRGGGALPEDSYGLLAGFVARAEQRSHGDALAAECRGQHREYLAALASELLVRGTTRIPQEDAAVVVGDTTTLLRERGLVGDPPDAAAVLRTLVDHHLLIAGSGARKTVGFIHQRFQEWFGAEHLRRLIQTDGIDSHWFQSEVCDRVAWGESLVLLMDKWRREGENDHAEQLLMLAFPVDPALAVTLAARASSEVWEMVGPDLETLTRRFSESGVPTVAEYGANLMVLSQKPSFSEDVRRALHSEDDGIRFDMYDRLARFGLGVLGDDWPERAHELPGGAAGFIHGLRGRAGPHVIRESVQPFQTIEDSAVRAAAIEALIWAGYADEAVSWILNSQPAIVQESDVLRDIEMLPEEHVHQLRDWLSAALEHFDPDPPLRLRALLSRLSHGDALGDIKEELDSHPPERPAEDILELLKQRDPAWLCDWITRHLPFNLSWDVDWEEYLRHEADRAAERLVQACIEGAGSRGAATNMARLAESLDSERTAAELGEAFAQRWNADVHPRNHREETALDEALRAVSGPTTVRAILYSGVEPKTPASLELLLRSLRSGRNREEGDLGGDIRRRLRSAVGRWLSILQESDEPVAGVRASLASVIGACGEPEDAETLLHLIELDRADAQREEEETGRRRAIHYQNLYVRALVDLNSEPAADVLRRLLAEPEYVGEAGRGLAELATPERPRGAFDPPYWKKAAAARDEGRPTSAPHSVVSRIRDALVAHLAVREEDPDARPFSYDLGTAITALATLDGRAALDLVPRLLPLEGTEFGLTATLEAVLSRGEQVPGSIAERVFEKLLARLDRWGPAIQDQELYSLINGLGLMLLSTEPSTE